MPTTTKLLHLKVYNGSTCPDIYIDASEWPMPSLKLDKKILCTHFPTTLDGNVGAWFKSLTPNNIRTFAKLKELFLTNIKQLRKYKGDVREIISCKKNEGESIQDYFKCFNKATLDVPGQSDNLVTGAFTHDLLPVTLSKRLLGKIPTTRKEMKKRVLKYVRQEEGTTAKESYMTAATT